jgi:hypothetical protein
MGQAVAALAAGNFLQGWRLYEARWDFPDYPGHHLPIEAPRVLSLADMAGRRVLLWPEQGPAETIQMLRFVPAVSRVAAGVILAVQPELKRLAATLPGVDSVITDGDTFESVDCQCPLMSLPFLLRTRLGNLPVQAPYLHAPVDTAAAWRDNLGASRSLRIGLVLRDSRRAAEGSNHSLPVAHLIASLRLPGIEYHILENHPDVADRAFVVATPAARSYAGQLPDLADIAALATNLDLIVTVDSAVAHLAGALGRPVWIALPAQASWVWMTGRDDSPWYPTARLFRQTTPGDWGPAIDRLRDALWQKRPSIIL